MSEPAPATVGGFKVEWEPPSPVNGVSGPPDILLRGSDDAVVKAHKAILSFSTEMFSAILAMDVDEAAPGLKLEGLDVLRFDQPAAVIALVIRHCYNIPGLRSAETSRSATGARQDLEAYKLAHRFTALRSQTELGVAICLYLKRGNYSEEKGALALKAYASAYTFGDDRLVDMLHPHAARAYSPASRSLDNLPGSQIRELVRFACLQQILARSLTDETQVDQQAAFRLKFARLLETAMFDVGLAACSGSMPDCRPCEPEVHVHTLSCKSKWLGAALVALSGPRSVEKQPEWTLPTVRDFNYKDYEDWAYDVRHQDEFRTPCESMALVQMSDVEEAWLDLWHINTA